MSLTPYQPATLSLLESLVLTACTAGLASFDKPSTTGSRSLEKEKETLGVGREEV